MLTLSTRPRLINEIVGHEHITTLFKEYLKKDNVTVPQVMMLAGSTGLGKTSLAYIIASTLNCHNPKYNEEGYIDPCLECSSCQSVINETFERDIALFDCSNSGKSDVKKLEELVGWNPLYDRNHIILIEEFSKLASDSARDSFLKFIEKPRKNVFFILTTMSLHNIHKSIIDRCKPFYFQPFNEIDDNDLIKIHVRRILKEKEMKVRIPEIFYNEVIAQIIKCSHGSLRAIIQNVDSALSYGAYTKNEYNKKCSPPREILNN